MYYFDICESLALIQYKIQWKKNLKLFFLKISLIVFHASSKRPYNV